MAKLMRYNQDYAGGSMPPLSDGLQIDENTGELTISTATEEDISNLINGFDEIFTE